MPSSRERARYRDLLAIATDLFARRGYERTTVRELADAMGIESGSLYSHISSKEDLLREIIVHNANEYFERSQAALAPGGGAEQRLRALCRAHMRVMTEERNACLVYFKEWRKLPEHVRTEIAGLRKQYEETFEGVIRAGTEEGAFGRVDPRWGALVVLSTLNWTFEWYSPDGPLSADEVADRLVDVVLSGLRRTPA
jgi:AcrR family transcriptional regulator